MSTPSITMSTPSPVMPDDQATSESTGRRRFLSRLSGLGAAAVGAIAVTFADTPSASAVSAGCCALATSTPCGGHWNNDGNFSCPSGYTKHYWPCCCGYFIYHCWECAKGSNCDAGPWACSNYWNYYLAGCCKSGCGC